MLHSSHHHCYNIFVVGLSDAHFCPLEPIQIATAITSAISLSFYHIVNQNLVPTSQTLCNLEHSQWRHLLAPFPTVPRYFPFPSPLYPFCAVLWDSNCLPGSRSHTFSLTKHYFCVQIHKLPIFKHIRSLQRGDLSSSPCLNPSLVSFSSV